MWNRFQSKIFQMHKLHDRSVSGPANVSHKAEESVTSSATDMSPKWCWKRHRTFYFQHFPHKRPWTQQRVCFVISKTSPRLRYISGPCNNYGFFPITGIMVHLILIRYHNYINLNCAFWQQETNRDKFPFQSILSPQPFSCLETISVCLWSGIPRRGSFVT